MTRSLILEARTGICGSGLTNNRRLPRTFVWSSGLTNTVYTNWANGQPDNICGTANYTFMLGATNRPGLWTLANNNGFTCAQPADQPTGLRRRRGGQPPAQRRAVLDFRHQHAGHDERGVRQQQRLPLREPRGRQQCRARNLFRAGIDPVQHLSARRAHLQHELRAWRCCITTAPMWPRRTSACSFPKTGGDVLLGKDMSLADEQLLRREDG